MQPDSILFIALSYEHGLYKKFAKDCISLCSGMLAICMFAYCFFHAMKYVMTWKNCCWMTCKPKLMMFAFAWWFVNMVLNTAEICCFIEIIAKVLKLLGNGDYHQQMDFIIWNLQSNCWRDITHIFYMSFIS